jgi:D-amino-acid dehydrogenase
MTVAVLGAGVLGVTTAYYLAKAGEAVTVIDRQPRAAAETSFANAGLVAPGHSYAWASPRAPLILLRSLWRNDTALRYRLRLDPAMWSWSLRFLANCTAAANRRNTLVKLELCKYSREQLVALRAAEGLRYDEVVKGSIYLYREPEHFETGKQTTVLITDHGYPMEAIDMDRVVAIEPALARSRHRFAGAILVPKDESGDCRLFTERLAEICKKLGVTFRYGTTVQGFAAEGDKVTAAETDRGRVPADRFVLALGSYSPFPARSIGLKLPIFPVKGYSMTVPVKNPAEAPTVGLIDEGYLVAFSRMGDRLRMTATADFAGYDTSYTPREFETMLKVSRELFPEGAHYDQQSPWACLRPMTPDGPPIMGPTRYKNLFMNTGHGHIGWTMACGSARMVADLMLGRKPALGFDGLTLDRY